MSYTRGPWRIGNLESYDGYTGKPFRNVWAGEDDCIARAIDVGDVDANARLIAAAPDLLRALQMWVDHFDNLESLSDPDDPLSRMRRDYFAKHLDASRKAIAKARGES